MDVSNKILVIRSVFFTAIQRRPNRRREAKKFLFYLKFVRSVEVEILTHLGPIKGSDIGQFVLIKFIQWISNSIVSWI